MQTSNKTHNICDWAGSFISGKCHPKVKVPYAGQPGQTDGRGGQPVIEAHTVAVYRLRVFSQDHLS